MKRISMILVSILLGLSFMAPIAVSAATTPTEAKNNVCEGIGGCTTAPGEPDFNSTVAFVVNTMSIIVGVVAVLAIIFAGFRYITAVGDSSKISSAKDTIIYALVGLVVVGLSQVIVKFVVNAL